jgi:ABC-2 type transport system ATP-binding protein
MGKTILISSHILPEVEELCTWFGVIDRGRMVQVGPKADVLRTAAGRRQLRVELVNVDEAILAAARQRVEQHEGVTGVETVEDGLEVAVVEGFPNHRLLRDLVQAGFDVAAFTPLAGTLSDIFMRLTEAGAEAG